MSSSITLGTPYAIDSATVSNLEITSVNLDNATVVYNHQTAIKAVSATIVDKTPTFGPTKSLHAVSGDGAVSITKQNDNEFVSYYAYPGASTFVSYATIASDVITEVDEEQVAVDANSIHVEKIPSLTNHGLLLKSTAANEIRAHIYDLTSGSIAVSSHTEIENTWENSHISMCKQLIRLDANGTRFLYIYSDSNNSNYTTAMVIKPQPGYIAFGSPTVISSFDSGGHVSGYCTPYFENKPVVFYRKEGIIWTQVLTIDDTTINTNTEIQLVPEISFYPSGDWMNDLYGVVGVAIYQDPVYDIRTIAVKQDNVTLTLEAEENLGAFGGASITRISGDKFAIAYADMTYTPYLVIADFYGPVAPQYPYTDSGSITISGDSITSLSLSYLDSGSFTFTGDAITTYTNDYFYITQGNISITGNADTSFSTNPDYVKKSFSSKIDTTIIYDSKF